MLRNLQSLFGMSGLDEPIPGASDAEKLVALEEAGPLMAAMERAPVLSRTENNTYDNKPPEPSPTLSNTPTYGPGMR